MKRNQAGFTMIELIVVIVILGILAATALPRFVNLTGEARQSATEGLAGAANSAMSINYAGCAANNFTAGANCQAVNSCDDVAGLLQGATPLAGYTVTGTLAAGNGSTGICTLTNTTTTAATATFMGIRTAAD